jgi:tetratricopeptide (TPR) repeat protein
MSIITLFIISFYLWHIEVIGLFILYVLFLWEDFYFGIIFEDTRLFLMFFGSIIVFIIAFFVGFPGAGVVCLLCFIALPLVINQINEEERILKEKRIEKDKEEIDRLNKHILKEGDDAGIFIRLGYLYKDIGDSENALKSLKKAIGLTKEDVLTVTEREIRSLEDEINNKKRKKTNICKHCGAQNYPTRIFCEKCKKLLETSIVNYFKRLFKSTFLAMPIIIFITVIFIISALLFWLFLGFFENLVFYGLLSTNIFMFIKKAIQAKFAYR